MFARTTRGAAIKQAALLARNEESNIPRLSNSPETSAPAKPASAAKQPVTKVISQKKHVPKVEAKSNGGASLTAPNSDSQSNPSTMRNSRRKKRIVSNKAISADGPERETESPTVPEKKRKRPVTSNERDGYMELPHNMGTVEWSSGLNAENEEAETFALIPNKRVPRGLEVKERKLEDNDKAFGGADEAETSSAKKGKTATQKAKSAKGARDAVNRLAALKAKLAKEAADAAIIAADNLPDKKSKRDPYGLTEGVTPFPNWSRPTTEECQEVHDILWNHHKNEVNPQPKTIPAPSELVAGCGEVRSILDALLRTKLSASTTFDHANAAYRGMVARYSLLESGVGKGSCNYNAVRLASVEDLYYAIGEGGLGALKSAEIKAILDMVYEENQQRRKDSISARGAENTSTAPKEAKNGDRASKVAEMSLADDENLSLDHCYTLSTDEAMRKFRTYPGIGVKTAACVALFCLQRPCFAVDTHVFRLSQWLGWTPPPDQRVKGQKPVDRDTMFSHLEVRVPDKLKYMLHQLFLTHGQSCPKCKAKEGKEIEDVGEICVIEHLVKRTRAKKGVLGSAKAKKVHSPAKKENRKRESKSDEDELTKMNPLEVRTDRAT